MNRSIILAAIVISAAILLNGYLDRATRAPKVVAPAEKPPATQRDKSVAVLPFENPSEDPEGAAFAAGVQQEITTDLANVHELKVTPAGDVMQYKSSANRNVRDIGRRLGVAHILEGSVQRSGGRVRIAVQLIDATTDRHLWAEGYDREDNDSFTIESEIAKNVAENVGATLSAAERVAIEQRRGSR